MLPLLIGLVLSSLSCLPYTGIPGGKPEPTPVPWDVETILFEKTDKGDYQFFTNDPELEGADGSTCWKAGSFNEETMASITVTLGKASGRPELTYGIVFCGRPPATGETVEDFLVLVINRQGDYTVYKKQKDKSFQNLLDKDEGTWRHSNVLKTDASYDNTVKIEYTGNNEFEVTFNYLETIKVQDQAPLFTGGCYGYLAFVSNAEDFPDHPVDVRFLQVEPGSIGMDDEALPLGIAGSIARAIDRMRPIGRSDESLGGRGRP